MMQKELPIPYTHDEILCNPDVINSMPKDCPGYHRFGVCKICGHIKWLGAVTEMKEGDEGKILIDSVGWLPADPCDSGSRCAKCDYANQHHGGIQNYIKEVALTQQRILQMTLIGQR